MILHIMVIDKFIPPFIDFINKHFVALDHKFIFIGKPDYKYGLTLEHKVEWIDSKNKIFKLLKYMYKSKKIILHGLWVEKLNLILFLQPWLLNKCYHVMWGGDFYFPEQHSWIKRKVIKKMGNFITYIKGDYELIKKWYSAKGRYHECFMYPSNLYKEYNIISKKHDTINIQIGNSATSTNNHLFILEKLLKYKDENIKIYVPLSYGEKEYAEVIIEEGKKLFGDKFIPITEFMPFEKYLEFLSKIDIAIFAHNRQQGMGNIITLLGLGKKVYISSDTTPWELFNEIGVKVYDVKNLDITPIYEETKRRNHEIIKNYFSEKRLKEQLINLFDTRGLR